MALHPSSPHIADRTGPATPETEPAVAVTRRRAAVSVLAEEAFHGIAGRITNGEYPPGSRINDRALAAEFGMSRTPVREAMQRLERIGLVEMHPSRYTVVTEVTDDMARATWEFAGLYASNVVHLAFPRLGDAEREHALTLVDEAAAAVDSRERWLTSQIALFGFLTEHSGNELYRCLLGDSWYLVLRNLIWLGISTDARPRITEALARLGEAIRDGDRDTAARAASAVFGVS
jgi:DNA-binding GntR family transcriptional regulator